MNPKDIADKIIAIQKDPARASLMGKNGIQAVKRNYNWDREKETLFQVYALVMGK